MNNNHTPSSEAQAIHRKTFGTSLLPCPDWCEFPSGHGYDIGDGSDVVTRVHQRHVLDEAHPFLVAVSKGETLHLDGQVTEGELRIEVSPRVEGADITPAQTRQLAAALNDAADAAEALCGTRSE